MRSVDLVLREAVDAAGAFLPPQRQEAVRLILGWEGQPAALAAAAHVAGVSRESVRRDRDRVGALLSENPDVRAAAVQVQELLASEGGRDVRDLANDDHATHLLLDTGALLAVVTTLKAAGQLSSIRKRPASDGRQLLEVDYDAGARERVLAELSMGTPRDLGRDPELLAAALELQRTDEAHALGAAGTWFVLGDASGPGPGQRALARVLTMTGPLAWSDLLAAWARAAGRDPYAELPPRVDVLTQWARTTPGVEVREDPPGTAAGVAAAAPAELDKTSAFLLEALRGAGEGVERPDLLVAAQDAGLAASSVVGALSRHPALVSAGRGRWALRSSSWSRADPPAQASRASPRRRLKNRPATFAWSARGELLLEFSVPAGPSPVIAIPSALAPMLSDRQLTLSTADGSGHGVLTIRDARAWGFGPAVRHLSAEPGQRMTLTCDLVEGTATVSAM